jgi:hypothetical protein
MSLVNQLLSEESEIDMKTASHLNENEESLLLDEEVAMRRMAIAMNAADGEIDETMLSEAKSIIKLNRQAKTNNLAHRAALLMAKGKNDPVYTKYAKFNGIRLQLREIIYRKYGSKAIARARALMSGTASTISSGASSMKSSVVAGASNVANKAKGMF